jgi:hypothetical protein
MLTPILHLCWLCSNTVDLRTCKIDEYGEAVHEACYTVRITLENSAREVMPVASKVDTHISIARL